MKKNQSKHTAYYLLMAVAGLLVLASALYLSLSYRIQEGEEAIHEQLQRQSIELEELKQTVNSN